ncbi:Acyl dehydratase [Arthrobacter subterraneus]|uniref:Acyl dehydratase n=1 Tax=Arthrobacter subterraneus TaxID=335973 RepID=A0A1G8EMP8_9MICC|nr:MaoC family dehydratase [Arthrobacter subterraneus]SDH71125.1 Acyl dehydratase [Arthrobacter subterraneus]
MEQLLHAPPRLTALYAAALARSAKPGRSREAGSLRLPTDRHRLDGVTAVPEKVREFQHLMRSPQTAFLPSGYLHIVAFPVAVSVLARPDFPLPLLGMIHLRNEVQHLRPVPTDARLSVVAGVENLRPHRSGTQVDVVVEVEAAGVPVWTGRSTYLAKGIQASSTLSAPSTPAEPGRDEGLPAFPTGEWSLSADTGRRYAAVSGDYNPIHLGVPSARLLGMKRPIAHGMYLASRMVAEAGPGEDAGFRWTVEFRTPVPLPSKILLSAQVDRSDSAKWHGAEVVAWDPRRRRAHFVGRLEALG